MIHPTQEREQLGCSNISSPQSQALLNVQLRGLDHPERLDCSPTIRSLSTSSEIQSWKRGLRSAYIPDYQTHRDGSSIDPPKQTLIMSQKMNPPSS
ncbi:hypothetical protein DID88_004874 [Monilinia fructigena]|uniref:Uncharacterized protein n=1 Tax=Monilinia fructigena TaxID=38457 RepID=A0A395IRT6_9HELO|nr:hypothetical protein DID88_004874 [Monilinia fructigena]